MSSLTISWIVFACIFGGSLVGMMIRAMLPEHHLSSESKDVIKLGMGLVASMAALVLGLLVASAKSSLDTQRNELTQMSANILLVDRVLAHYGPETQEVRGLVRRFVGNMVDRLWPKDSSPSKADEPIGGSEVLYDKLQDLAPKNDAQRTLQSQALKSTIDIAQTRLLLFAQKGSSIPLPFLVVLVFWLAILFASFSLYSRPNPTMIITLLVSALSVSGAIFLILEMDHPFDGLIQISSDPLRRALEQLGK